MTRTKCTTRSRKRSKIATLREIKIPSNAKMPNASAIAAVDAPAHRNNVVELRVTRRSYQQWPRSGSQSDLRNSPSGDVKCVRSVDADYFHFVGLSHLNAPLLRLLRLR